MKTRYEALRERAMDVLGVSKDATPDQIRDAAYRRIFIYHPDRNPDNPDSNDITKVIVEALHFLQGRTHKTASLEDDYLVTLVINNPVRHIDEVSYEEWLLERFGGIWPDNSVSPNQQPDNPDSSSDDQSQMEHIINRGFFDFVSRA